MGTDGHYYHKHVIIPKLLALLDLSSSLLDLGCGQGILARHLQKDTPYLGIDISPSLIRHAQRLSKHTFMVADLTKPLQLKQSFAQAVCLLSLQNMAQPYELIKNAHLALESNGRFICVLNHPCFRIPRQSSWNYDEKKQIQYRRIDAYSSPMHIPIQTHPGSTDRSQDTWSFHFPLSTYSTWLKNAGFMIEEIAEWHSDKVSTGKMARAENRSRAEFPLFLTLVARVNKK